MPHERKRHLCRNLSKALAFSPIVGVLGHRQVGKTTLCEKFANRYVSFDVKNSRENAEEDPDGFIKNHLAHPLVLDECQLVPDLFPALKEHVRLQKKTGQFLLTGSVRFTSRKVIRESLTGRIVNYELLPFDLSEIHQESLPDTIPSLLKSKKLNADLKDSKYVHEKQINSYLQNGGLPGFFSIRDKSILRSKFETQIETLLERDLRLLIKTTLPLKTLRSLCSTLAQDQGKPINLREISRKTRVSPPTLTLLINAFESMFLIRRVVSKGGIRKDILYFEDQGEASHLTEYKPKKNLDLPDLERFIFANIRHQWMYRSDPMEFFQYSTKGGARVPFCLKKHGKYLGIIPMLEENPGLSAIRSAISFQKTYNDSKILFVHPGEKNDLLHDTQRIVPVSMLL